MPIPPADPDRFEEAIKAFRKRVPMSDADWGALTDAEKEFAFKVSGVAQARVTQDVFDALDRAIRDGTTLDDFKAAVGDKLAAEWGAPDGARIETVFRTNVMGAYNAGRHAIISAPAVRKVRPYLRFDSVGDSRMSEICEELDGTILPADDPFWARHTPPLHHNCRSVLTPLTAEEAGDEGIDDAPDTDAAPDQGFGKEPAEAGADWEPDTAEFDPSIRGELDRRLK